MQRSSMSARWVRRMLVLAAMMMIAVAACQNANGSAPSSSPGENARTGITPTPPAEPGSRAALPVALVQPPATATPVPTATPAGASTIHVWWPEELYPAEGTVANDVLNSQFESFRLTYSSYSLDIRRKRMSGLGGILSTLRTAQPVAPGAIPDLTLMRRSELLTAATEGLIMPLTDWIPPDLVGTNLFPGVLALGEIDGELYGLPYAINVVHSLYRATVFDEPLITFSDVLAAEPALVFDANHTASSAVSLTVLLQYIAAGGRLVDATGQPVLDYEPLVVVLSFYEQALERGIVDETLLHYDEPEDYWASFASAQANLIGVDAWTYLRHKESVPNVGFAPIPTVEGTPITSLDGWMWVLTTHDPDRSNQARVFLSWIMRVSQHSLFSESMGVLPSQQRALRLWDDTAYAEFVQSLILSGEIIPLAQRTGSSASALHDAFVAVLEGTPAQEAADAALQALALPGG